MREPPSPMLGPRTTRSLLTDGLAHARVTAGWEKIKAGACDDARYFDLFGEDLERLHL